MVLARDSLRASRDDPTNDNTGPTNANSSSLAQVGTRFVDASGDRELSQLVNTMAGDQSVVGQRLELLYHQQQAAAETVDALRKLLQHKHARPDELARAEQQRHDLEKQIQQMQQAMRQQEELGEHYQHRLPSRPITAAQQPALETIDKQLVWYANVIRHRLEMTRRMLRAIARQSANDARHQYLVEKMKRVTRIPQRLRAPKELRHIRHKVQAAKLQQAVVDSEIAAFEQEQQRFERQLQ